MSDSLDSLDVAAALTADASRCALLSADTNWNDGAILTSS